MLSSHLGISTEVFDYYSEIDSSSDACASTENLAHPDETLGKKQTFENAKVLRRQCMSTHAASQTTRSRQS